MPNEATSIAAKVPVSAEEHRISSVEAFQVTWRPDEPPGRRTALVRVRTDSGLTGYGEASPMMGGEHSLLVVRDFAESLVGADPFDQAVIHDRLLHRYVKLGPEGAVTGALAALDLALWDIKGKVLGLPVYKLLGGAWRTKLPCLDRRQRRPPSRSAGTATGRGRITTSPATSPRPRR